MSQRSDENKIRTALARAEDARVFAESVLHTVWEPLIVLDAELEVIFANERFYDTFLVDPADTIGQQIYGLGNGQWDIPGLRRALEDIVPSNAEFSDWEVQSDFPSIGQRTMMLNGRRVGQKGDRRSLVLLAFQDVTDRKRAEEALHESERKYRELVENINSIIVKADRKGVITFVNAFAKSFFGLTEDEAIGRPLFGGLIPEDKVPNGGVTMLQDVLTNPDAYYIQETETQREDGAPLLFSWSMKAVRDIRGEIVELMIDGNDLTPTIEYRQRLDDALELIDHTPDAIASFDRGGRVQFVNRVLVDLFGFRETITHKRVDELANTYTQAEWMLKVFLQAQSTRRTAITEVPVKDTWFQFLASPKLDLEGRVVSVMLFGRDITASKHYEQALTHEAMHDPLTALPNRRSLERRLEEEWRRTARHDQDFSLLLIDVDSFKAYNDHYGHLAGDECLRKVADVLQRCLHRPGDIVARYGGEEFMILLPETPPDGARKLGEEILQQFAQAAIPHAASPIAPYVTVSIGLTGTSPRRSSPWATFALADQALYNAKKRGRNRIEVAF